MASSTHDHLRFRAESQDGYTEMVKTQAAILEELRELNALQQKLANQPPIKTQEIMNAILQIFGLTVGTLFGVFAILAWKAADTANGFASKANDYASGANGMASSANSLATDANKLALLAQCQNITSGYCMAIQSSAMSSLSTYASRYYGITALPTTVSASTLTSTLTTRETTLATIPLPTTTSAASAEPTSTSDSSAGTSSLAGPLVGVIVGSIVGLAFLVAAMILSWRTYRAKVQRSKSLSKQIDSGSEKI